MLTLVSKLYVGLIKGLAVVAALLIVVSIIMVVVDVSARALGRGSFRATIAVVEYILLYFTLLSAPYLLYTRGHVLVDMAIKALPVWPRRLLEAAIYLLGMLVCTIFAVISIQIMRDAMQRGYFDERSIDLPYWLLYAAFPLCFGLMTIEFGRYLVTRASLYDADEKNQGL
jgi:C4-dicarboxylate transporter, DctQ subunit